MTPLQVGVIGYGYLGAHYASAVARLPDAQLAGVAAPSHERQVAARAAYPAARVVGDYRELLDVDDIDLMIVAVPNSLHFGIGTNVLRAGKHLLLEKPLALNLVDCDRMLALARKQRRMLAIGHQWRVSPLCKAIAQLLEEEVIGRPLFGELSLARAPYRLGSGGWRFDPERVGSWVFEETLHLFDLARWYLGARGEPVSVYARGNTRDPDHPRLQDNFSSVVSFPDHSFATLSQSLASFGHHLSIKVTGTRGMLWGTASRIDVKDARVEATLRYGHGSDVHEAPRETLTSDRDEFQTQLAAVVKCVRDGAAPPCSGEDGRWSTLLGLAARDSAESGGEVSLAQFVTRPDNLEA